MKQYIERSELVSRIYKYVELTNPEEQEWVKDECIRQVHAMPSVNVGEWISVDERLTEELTHVIVCDEDGTVGEAFCYKEGRFEWMDSEELAFVTHWMPLPDAPKGD